MIPVTTFAGRHVAVFGLGASGRATALALAAGGATVVGVGRQRRGGRGGRRATGIAVADLKTADWAALRRAGACRPASRSTHPAPHWSVARARAAGVEVIGDIELFCRERRRHAPGAPFVAVTGTNGKSTTTALIAHLLREAGRDVEMGGNIGNAILALEPPAAGRVHVIECSSFQIDLAPSLDPSIGVLLNITADHLDRHGTLDAYAAIKERLVAASATAVIAVDDDCLPGDRRPCGAGRHARRCGFRPPRRWPTAFTARAAAPSTRRRMASAVKVADLTGIGSLRGAHNAQNAVAAVAVCRVLGLADADIAAGLKTFPGLPHRMEEVGRRGRVALRQRFQGDQRRRRGQGAGELPAHLLDRRRPSEGGRHHQPQPISSRASPGPT